MYRSKNGFILFFVSVIILISCQHNEPEINNRIVFEMSIGESGTITLSDGQKVNITLIDTIVQRDRFRNAVRDVGVKLQIDDYEMIIKSGNYSLPVEAGNIMIDCPVTRALYNNTSKDRWGLSKDVRLRIWEKDAPYLEPGTFVYPLKQSWFASNSQMGNEPTFVITNEKIINKSIYYHSGLDFGGAEGMDTVLSATDGLVVSSADSTLTAYEDLPGDTRKDVVYIVDHRNWYYRYSHLDSVYNEIKAGTRIKMGQPIGLIGKKGFSGGWVHLHFEIKNKENPAGIWATEDAYVYIWEAYKKQFNPGFVAVARPHHLVATGDKVILDASRSIINTKNPVNYQWQLSDGRIVDTKVCDIEYDTPGNYCEILCLKDDKGNIDYDFTTVLVLDNNDTQKPLPGIQIAFHPTQNIQVSDTITFLIGTTGVNKEAIWDFGDGSPEMGMIPENITKENRFATRFKKIQHSYKNSGDYIVQVKTENEEGIQAMASLHVKIN